jgi:hypothetical protein
VAEGVVGPVAANVATPTTSGGAGASAGNVALESDSATGALGSTVGSALGLGAAGYGAYTGIQGARKTVNQLKAANSSGALTEQEQEDARQKVFNRGMVNMGIGGVAGGLGGGSVLGAALGGSGGSWQATHAYDDTSNPRQNTLKASLRFAANPLKR